MKDTSNFRLSKVCDVCQSKGLIYKVWLPNQKKYIFACPECMKDFDNKEAFADAYESDTLRTSK